MMVSTLGGSFPFAYGRRDLTGDEVEDWDAMIHWFKLAQEEEDSCRQLVTSEHA